MIGQTNDSDQMASLERKKTTIKFVHNYVSFARLNHFESYLFEQFLAIFHCFIPIGVIFSYLSHLKQLLTFFFNLFKQFWVICIILKHF